MILEGPFDKLVQKIRGKKNMNVSTWETMGERLDNQEVKKNDQHHVKNAVVHTVTSLRIPYCSQIIPRSKHLMIKSVLS